MKKIVTGICLTLVMVSCKKDAVATPEGTPKDSVQQPVSVQKAEIADFKEAQQVDNINDVPFVLYSKTDSVSFYTEPKADARVLKIKNDKLNHYYGFKDLKDFFEIHYTIAYQPNRTITVYVSKKEFTKDSQLSLQGTDLNEIRSSTVKGVDDFKTKNSVHYATVSIIDEAAYGQVQGKSLNEKITPNPNVHFDGNAWSLNFLKISKKEVDEEAEYSNQYIGYSPVTQREFFVGENSYNSDRYYTAYRSSKQDEGTTFLGYPAVNTMLKVVASIAPNQDVGSDFTLSRYNPQTDRFENLLYINFTNFKAADSQSLIWVTSKILYFKAHHLNTNTTDPDHKTEYLKIELTDQSF
ncbi:MAG: hypothetical protein LBE92_11205 [Chryseobacterium sp.]|jgi:hypothetical protein|uniref:hypothetical protein n=1 Tax=Chryseobacterium sp. TaxID=1871047 RepID=UPI00281BDBFD|nr:hypothetical protein [Chryseobacterium sp.]MDR2236683.1 hypothetical protein [Chryseobacterium sp.]